MSHSQPVGTRYCKYDLSGESSIYICPRDEYCCNVGCCISPTFQFYQLWYYWFMVFFMFLICSGGQWWYRYVMQGRCASAMPPPPRRASYPRQCRVAYTPARDTVVLHHLWKPSYAGINGPPPSYSQSGAGSSSGQGGPKPSPYMQLYGPPPSYESVIGASPVPIHHLTGPGGLMEGPNQSSIQVGSLPPEAQGQRFETALPPMVSSQPHHHHRQGSGGNSSHQQQAVPTHYLTQACVRRCSSSHGQQHHHPHHSHHHQHIQKIVVEPTREAGESGMQGAHGPGTGLPPPPAHTGSEVHATGRPMQEGPVQLDPQQMVVIVPASVLSPAGPPSPAVNHHT